MLAHAENVSITTDIWTSLNVDSFIMITGHFLKKINLNKVVLCTKNLRRVTLVSI